MNDSLPHDERAERAILGAAMLAPAAAEIASQELAAEDFFHPRNQTIFKVICRLRSEGLSIDPITIADRSTALDKGELISMMVEVPAIQAIRSYVEIVQRHAASRSALGKLDAARRALLDRADPYDIVLGLKSSLNRIESPAMVRAPGDKSGREFLAEDLESSTPWVIPSLLRADWRCMFIGFEGGGRSTLLRQLGICLAYGVHPFKSDVPIPSGQVLLIDLENPALVVQTSARQIDYICRRISGDERGQERWRLWHRDAGVDLRSRIDRAELEDILRRQRPKLVCIGPLYKSFFRASRESYEEPALQMQQILDDLRHRYGFALVIEHHAPHAQGEKRELRPEGSSLWLRWGELRWALTPVQNEPPYRRHTNAQGIQAVRREGFSGDRVRHSWPEVFVKGGGGQLPWVGWWRDGIPQEPPRDAYDAI